MMVVFFTGIGLSSIFASTADTPIEMSICLTLVGTFAAIYHPVGLAMVVQGLTRTGGRPARFDGSHEGGTNGSAFQANSFSYLLNHLVHHGNWWAHIPEHNIRIAQGV